MDIEPFDRSATQRSNEFCILGVLFEMVLVSVGDP